MATDGYLCGWRVHSELALPELAPWCGDDRPPDVVVRLGSTPRRLDGAVQSGPFVQVDAAAGACLLDLPNVATYHVVGPEEVVVEPQPGAAETEVRLFLLGSVLGYLCHLRGLFPLHASSVAIGDRAVAFSGISGAGKSTTAVHLARRGHALLADDVCAIDTRDAPVVMPAFPRLKLWQDSLASTGVDSAGLERNRPGQAKYHYRLAGDFTAAPVPLAAIFLLVQAEPGRPEGITRLAHPLDIIPALAAEVFRPQVAELLGCKAALFRAQAALASSVPVYSLARPFQLSQIDGWLDQVEAIVR